MCIQVYDSYRCTLPINYVIDIKYDFILRFSLFREEGDTALHLIASLTSSSCDEETMEQMAEIAEVMVQKGADINRQNRKG